MSPDERALYNHIIEFGYVAAMGAKGEAQLIERIVKRLEKQNMRLRDQVKKLEKQLSKQGDVSVQSVERRVEEMVADRVKQTLSAQAVLEEAAEQARLGDQDDLPVPDLDES